jgi:hypothetical protein
MLGSRAMQLPRAGVLLLVILVVALAGVLGLAVQREMRPSAALAPMESAPAEQAALSADEEVYAAALWPIHSEVVEASAVELSYVGVSYVTEHHDAQRLAAKVAQLHDTFKAVDAKAHALQVPSSMQHVHGIYLEALSLLADASAEMLKVAQDGKLDHLIDAQTMTHRAAEDLLKVGDVLWPGEHKPN